MGIIVVDLLNVVSGAVFSLRAYIITYIPRFVPHLFYFFAGGYKEYAPRGKHFTITFIKSIEI